MKKPIANMYTIIWVEVPDAPAQRGTGAPGAAMMGRLRGLKARAGRFWQGPRLAGALAGAIASLTLIFTAG